MRQNFCGQMRSWTWVWVERVRPSRVNMMSTCWCNSEERNVIFDEFLHSENACSTITCLMFVVERDTTIRSCSATCIREGCNTEHLNKVVYEFVHLINPFSSITCLMLFFEIRVVTIQVNTEQPITNSYGLKQYFARSCCFSLRDAFSTGCCFRRVEDKFNTEQLKNEVHEDVNSNTCCAMITFLTFFWRDDASLQRFCDITES